MTLVKAKPKRPTVDHKKRLGKHHRHSHDYIKTYWPYLPIAAILTFGLVINSWLGQIHQTVLGYATDMSIQSLLDDTNAQRTQNGETGLSINAQLNTAAQNKANDMAARDYWSHNTPDGQTPWSFMSAAGYTYITAGENLAYGFDTAADTVTGWMNSTEHRANILNTSFHDVGFGIVNIPDYQGTGPETLVVAMYGSHASAPVAAVTPRPASPAVTQKQVESTAQPAVQTPTTQPTTKNNDTLVATPSTKQSSEPAPQRISRIQLVASNAPMSSLAVSMFGLAAFAFFILRHGLAWRRVFVRGEAFLVHHPLFDIAATSIASLSIILSHTSGLIR